MNSKILFSSFYLFLLSLLSGQQQQVLAHRQPFGFRPTKLFVFGDSYVDTGNNPISLTSSWKPPYGVTFPGKPAGRFSDGRVSTDYLAKFLGIKSPIPYRWRKFAYNHVKYGMNFAYGGTGVFETLVQSPNMTTQIDFFEQLIKDGVYTPTDLMSSMALVSVAGNDYSTYIQINGSAQGWQPFITQVVNQLTLNLKRIHGLGVKKIVVPTLQPLGCLPRSASKLSFRQCNATENSLTGFHNVLLQQAVAKLNSETKDSAFAILDLYSAFMSVFNNKAHQTGSSKFENPFKACCAGVSDQNSCGDVDDNGAKLYTVCNHPEAAFFWDQVHPTQEGWRAVYSALKANLQLIF
ncbi:GDSL esterase/lipase [Melia azedarach]|uniref:GDSL esterase/lipase n=1 Tax=Melia azedarach TaxID=155640 RepID=A0ACC1X1Y1_MELAZ|nr:GDSL esterase/lipase [Melia azedarach]